MTLYYVIALVFVTFLGNVDVLLATTEFGENAVIFFQECIIASFICYKSNKNIGGRSLRVGKATNTDEMDPAEDRGVLTSLVGNLNTRVNAAREAIRISKEVKAWVKSGKSDFEAQSLLGLAGMSDDVAGIKPNYEHFEKFLIRKYRFSDMLINETPTYNVWVTIGFGNIRTADQLPIISNTAKFKLYERYVKAFDRVTINKLYSYRTPVQSSSGASDAEMTARIMLLAKQRRPDPYYAKCVLGINKLNAQAVTHHSNYKYYQLYLKLANQAA
ncbi:unnamed protein product [Phytophthora lilii]|uniref:Unnamed protein product n=1 Tax=Phytophthora lilii TaxID=2077276 RepID=A0A9W7D969_9STRA|nr:unnamed protein product [Phytophthora lilii]